MQATCGKRLADRRGPIRWAWMMLMCVLGSPALAASLQVSPTSLTLTATQHAEALWLTNSGTTPVNVQVRVFKWTQANLGDTLTPTQDLVPSPPMQTIAPGARQLVRLVRPDKRAPGSETSYRVIVDELPGQGPQQGLQFVLRYSVPVFLLPEGPMSDPALQATLVAVDAEHMALELHNAGGKHAQIADLGYAAPGGEIIALPGLVGYVQPGQTMRWSLPGAPGRYTDTRFSARINGEAVRQPLPLASPAR